MVANRKIGGHPDLLPKAKYTTDSILKGLEGIEVKTSIQRGGWQGHNPEECWMVWRSCAATSCTGFLTWASVAIVQSLLRTESRFRSV
jgi:hypothetical protein